MKKKLCKIISILAASLFILSCRHSSSKRDAITFKDSIGEVINNLKQFDSFLNMLPEPQVGYGRDVSFKNDILIINAIEIGKIDSLEKTTSPMISMFDLNQKKRFVFLIKKLKSYCITGAFKPFHSHIWFHTYRDLYDMDFDDTRSIVIVNTSKDTSNYNFTRENQILDRKDQLVLIAPKTAAVY